MPTALSPTSEHISPSILRVLNVLFEARYGGPPKRVSMVGEALLAHGVETVLCKPFRSNDALKVATQEPKIPVRQIAFEHIPRPRDLRRVLRWMVLLPRDVLRFMSLFRREKPDVVHVNGAFFIPPAIAAKLTGIPLVWHLNDTIVPARVAPAFGALVRLLADQIVVAAEGVASHYGVNGAAYEVIYAPVDAKRFRTSSLTSRERGRRVPRVGLIASWSPVKGVEYFVRAAAQARERLGGAMEIVFAGAKLPSHDEYCRGIERLIEELELGPAIHEHGYVPSVAEVLAGLDVLVLSSVSEASPMVVLEGMAAGVPVVATDVGGVRELLLNDHARPAGIVVQARDPEPIAAALIDLLQHPEKASLMGENGRQLANERFSLDTCVEKHLQIYTKIVNRC
jgi:glycosyltransferase involved in cell wall biosynthesis